MKWKLMEGRESYGEIREILYREAVGGGGGRGREVWLIEGKA